MEYTGLTIGAKDTCEVCNRKVDLTNDIEGDKLNATCKEKLANILARSADADNVEDEAMEESEGDPTRESE